MIFSAVFHCAKYLHSQNALCDEIVYIKFIEKKYLRQMTNVSMEITEIFFNLNLFFDLKF